MSVRLTDEELAKIKALSDTCWRAAVDQLLKDFPKSEQECQVLGELALALGLKTAGLIMTAAMMKAHIDICHQTGEMLQMSDMDEIGRN